MRQNEIKENKNPKKPKKKKQTSRFSALEKIEQKTTITDKKEQITKRNLFQRTTAKLNKRRNPFSFFFFFQSRKYKNPSSSNEKIRN